MPPKKERNPFSINIVDPFSSKTTKKSKPDNNPFGLNLGGPFGPTPKKDTETKRKPTPVSEKAKLLEEQGYQCALCQNRIEYHTCHVDHKKALKLGGSDTKRNKQLLCPNCHDVKTKEDRAKMSKKRQKEKESNNSRDPFRLY
jgi:hypothetical protein